MQSCTVGIAPSASSNLSYTGTLTISATTGGASYVELAGSSTGFGTATLAITPAWQKDMDVALPNTIGEWRTFTVKNVGATGTTSAITMTLSDSSSFETGNDACTGQTLAPQATCTIRVRPISDTQRVLCGDLTASATTGGSAIAALTGLAQTTDGGLSLQYPIADTMGTRYYATTNYGTATTTYSMNWSNCNSWGSKVHLKFDLAGGPQTADSALMHVFLNPPEYSWATGIQSPCTSGATVFTHNLYMNDAAWGENTLNWNNQPSDGAILNSFTSSCSNQLHGSQEFDITSAYNAWKSGTANNGLHIYSPTSWCNNNSLYIVVGMREIPKGCYKPWILVHEETP